MIFVAVALPALVLRSPSVARPKPALVMQSTDVRPGSMKEATILQGKRPYGEESRRYRRTVYGSGLDRSTAPRRGCSAT